jgi:ADP-heptose:LPS heptosyltransferase
LEENKWVEVINTLSYKGFNCVLSGAKWEKEFLNKIVEKCIMMPRVFTAKNGILDNAAFLKNAVCLLV